LERGELIFTIFGLLAEAATFVIDFNVYNAHDETVVPELIPVRIHHPFSVDTSPDYREVLKS
jgi:hypothetical protein